MNRKRRDQIQVGLFAFVLAGACLGQTASAVHGIEAFGWANDAPMDLILALTSVVMSAVLAALAVISPPGGARTAMQVGLGILLTTELAFNLAVGGLLVETRMPAGVAEFFGLPAGVADRLASFLLSGFLPVIAFLATYAITKTAERMLEEPAVNPLAERLLRDRGDGLVPPTEMQPFSHAADGRR